MHEQSLIINLIKKVESIARDNRANKVTSIKIKLGALSHTSPEHFREHFEPLAVGTVADGAKLNFIVSEDVNDPYAQDIMIDSIEVEEE